MVKIFNPKEDIQGNSKENIFIVMKDGEYIGNGYVYPKRTIITPEHPLNIFINIQLDEHHLLSDIGRQLFIFLKKRALELKELYGEDKCLLYYGAPKADVMIDFYIGLGFNKRMSTYQLESVSEIKGMEPTCEVAISHHLHEAEDVIELHNKYLIKPITNDVIHELSHHSDFICVRLYDDGLVGSMMGYSLDGVGYIDHVVVHEDHMKKGYGRYLLSKAKAHFLKHLMPKIRLQVWSANLEALEFYKKLNFKYDTETETYVGILL